MDDFYIVIPFKRLAKDWKKRLIDFNTLDIGSGFRKGLGQCADSRPDFKDQVPRTNLCFSAMPLTTDSLMRKFCPKRFLYEGQRYQEYTALLHGLQSQDEAY